MSAGSREDWVSFNLKLQVPEQLGISQAPSLTVAATLVDLAVLYDLAGKAWEHALPIVGLLAALREKRSTDDDALERPQDLAAYHWTAARLLPLDGRIPPAIEPTTLARLQEHVTFHRTTGILLLETMTLGSPLVLEFRIPWAYLANSGGFWAFIGAVEHLYRAAGRVKVNGVRARAESARATFRKSDAQRLASALQHIEFLSGDTADVALVSGEVAARPQ